MVDAIDDRDLTKIIWVYAFEAGHVEAELGGIRAPLVMRVDAADRAKIMLSCFRIPLIQGQFVFALQDLQPLQRD